MGPKKRDEKLLNFWSIYYLFSQVGRGLFIWVRIFAGFASESKRKWMRNDEDDQLLLRTRYYYAICRGR